MAYVAPMVADALSSLGALALRPPFDPTLGFGDGAGVPAVNLPLTQLPATAASTLAHLLPRRLRVAQLEGGPGWDPRYFQKQ